MSGADDNQQDQLPHFVNADGRKIVCRYWEPDGEPRALLFVCHGAGEHSACYDQVAKEFVRRGFKVFSHDHVGHGLSEGERVHVRTFAEYTRDVRQHVRKVNDEHGGHKDVFVVGHSLGGLITLRLALEDPDLFKGMLLIGTALVPMPEFGANLKLFAGRLVSYVFPTAGIRSLTPQHICRDPAVVERYETDPLVHHGLLTVKFVVEVVDTMSYVQQNLEQIQSPLWAIHGNDDKLTHVSGSTMIQDKAVSTDKTVKIIDGAYHQIHNEPNGVGTKCVQDMCDWVEAHC